MKKILLALLLLVFSTFSQENYVIIKSKNVNIYDGLSTDSAIVNKISSGKKLELIEYDDSYAKIMYTDKAGLDQVGYIKRNEVYVRETNTEKAISKIESLEKTPLWLQPLAINKMVVISAKWQTPFKLQYLW